MWNTPRPLRILPIITSIGSFVVETLKLINTSDRLYKPGSNDHPGSECHNQFLKMVVIRLQFYCKMILLSNLKIKLFTNIFGVPKTAQIWAFLQVLKVHQTEISNQK